MSSTYGGMGSGGGGTDYAAGFNLNPHQQRVLKAVTVSCCLKRVFLSAYMLVLSNLCLFKIVYLANDSGLST